MLEAIQKVVQKLRQANPDLTYGMRPRNPDFRPNTRPK